MLWVVEDVQGHEYILYDEFWEGCCIMHEQTNATFPAFWKMKDQKIGFPTCSAVIFHVFCCEQQNDSMLCTFCYILWGNLGMNSQKRTLDALVNTNRNAGLSMDFSTQARTYSGFCGVLKHGSTKVRDYQWTMWAKGCHGLSGSQEKHLKFLVGVLNAIKP